MLFKLSIKNIKKSIKDYAIYFFTLILGVAIFYIFNAMDSQEALFEVSSSKREIIQLMNTVLGGLSIFISFILGFLIIYASKFLIKRRKKEFGIYMTLGMGRGKISKILVLETILVGLLSLVVGLIIGIASSQFMSILVAKLFEIDMSAYTFVFSASALLKTILYFGIIYVLVMLFNTVIVSKCKLINLLTAGRKNEKVKIRNSYISVALFLIATTTLIGCYYMVTTKGSTIDQTMAVPICAVGAIATFLLFYSLSGFILKLIQKNKKLYLKNVNTFILRQMNSAINTTVFSMTIICLMLFLTICIFATSISLNQSFAAKIKEVTPVDMNIDRRMDMSYQNDNQETNYVEYSKEKVIPSLEKIGISVDKTFKDVMELPTYTMSTLKIKDAMGSVFKEFVKQFPYVRVDTRETIMSVSDYNAVARLYKKETVSIQEDEYALVCNYKLIKPYREKALAKGNEIQVGGASYRPSSTKCIDGFISISNGPTNTGIFIVPDRAVTDLSIDTSHFIANYKVDNKKEKEAIESAIFKNYKKADPNFVASLEELTKLEIYAASTGLSAIVTFIGLYLGIVFLLTSAALLALKELSESSDNKERYKVLRKIGVDEKMLHKALFIQIGIFFLFPLSIAIIHSIFGIQFAGKLLASVSNGENMIPSIVLTAVFIILIYGGYFLTTYLCSKNIISERE